MKFAVRLLVLALACLFGLVLLVSIVKGAGTVAATAAGGSGGACAGTGEPIPVNLTGVPTEVVTTIQGRTVRFAGEQLVGAAQIMRAGADAAVAARGQTIGVMTSIGESTLTAVEHGDVAGPDSLGWFQQRDPWGPREVRLDAYGSATMFFTGGRGGQAGLLDIAGWETMTPTAAAHAVQRNADPYHYEKYWDAAVAIVEALVGAPIADVQPGAGNQVCAGEPGDVVVVPAGSWTRPNAGPVTSEYGPRWGTQHNGMDFGSPCKSPNRSAADGVVILVAKGNVTPATGYGTLVAVDHGGGAISRYAHAANEDVLVTVGQAVKAGETITRVGTYGQSTACHLHFEIQVDGAFVNPRPFLTQRDVDLAA